MHGMKVVSCSKVQLFARKMDKNTMREFYIVMFRHINDIVVCCIYYFLVYITLVHLMLFVLALLHMLQPLP